jgi:hypothetical protein
MRGSVRAPRFFQRPLKAITATLRDLSPLLQAHRSHRLKAWPIQSMIDAPYRWVA